MYRISQIIKAIKSEQLGLEKEGFALGFALGFANGILKEIENNSPKIQTRIVRHDDLDLRNRLENNGYKVVEITGFYFKYEKRDGLEND